MVLNHYTMYMYIANILIHKLKIYMYTLCLQSIWSFFIYVVFIPMDFVKKHDFSSNLQGTSLEFYSQ